MSKPSVGVFGLTGCAGDQLVVLNCEDEILDLFRLFDIRDFLVASSENDTECELDIALVEGAVLSRRDEETLERIRVRSRTLVAVGTCAVWGGVAAMDRGRDRAALMRAVYGEMGRRYDATSARALREVVPVDLRISGCPIEKHQLLSALASLLNGDVPLLPQSPVCAECKMREITCLLEEGRVCCGPLTASGCNARCPSLRIPCLGCFGPASDANVRSALALFEEKGIPRREILRKLRTFAAQDPGALTEAGGAA